MMTTVIVMTAQMNQEQMLVQIQNFTVQVEHSTCHPLALMMEYATVVMALMNGKELQ